MTEQLYLRRCRKHQLNLEEYGDHLVCPAGETHICEDFVVIDRKTGAVVNEVPEDEGAAPKTPPPGAAELIQTLAGGLRAKREPRKEKPMPMKKTEKAHGTSGRYWQGCRCRPCRTAVNEHVKALKAKRAGKAAPKGDVVHHRATKAAPVQKSTPVHKRAAKSTGVGDLESTVLRLRAELAAAEDAYLHHVKALLPGVDIGR